MEYTNNLCNAFINSLNSDSNVRRQAEDYLNSIILDVSALEILFQLLLNNQIQSNIKLCICTFIKNYVNRYINHDSQDSMKDVSKVMTNEAVNYFKSNTFVLLQNLQAPYSTQIQEWINIIYRANRGYRIIWPDLVTNLHAILNNKNYLQSLEIYQLIANFTVRYTEEVSSNRLFEEILDCLKICQTMTDDLVYHLTIVQNIIQSLQQQQSYDSEKESSLKHCCKLIKFVIVIAYNFCYQDFCEYFEDNLVTWINILLSTCNLCLSLNTKEAYEVNEASLKFINKLFFMYYTDIDAHTNKFLAPMWTMVEKLNTKNPLLEKITSEVIEFFKCSLNNRIFNLQPEHVNILITNLVFPNLTISQKEIEDYEDNPISFMKGEIEESDEFCNKSLSINLLKILNGKNELLLSSSIKPYYNECLIQYNQNPTKLWSKKIEAINLIFSTVIETFSTYSGASNIKISEEELSTLMNEIVIKELSSIESNKLIKIYSFKFLIYFRNQIPNHWFDSLIDILISLISKNDNVYTFGALLSLEKILMMKNPKNFKEYKITNELNSNNLLLKILNGIHPEMVKYNEQAMKCFFKSISLATDDNLKSIMQGLQNTLLEVYKILLVLKSENYNAEFNYQLFESTAFLLRKFYIYDHGAYKIFREEINVILSSCFTNNLTDLWNYVFQIYSCELCIDKEFTNTQSVIF